MTKIAVITGGASGLGLAVAKDLAAKKQDWKLCLLDSNGVAGAQAAESTPGAIFINADVTSWPSLSAAFDTAFAMFGSIDFVFANAGVVERDSFYETTMSAEGGRLPNAPGLMTLEINFKGVITTAYLAQHYFRLSPHKGKDAALVMTASVGGLYPMEVYPIYAGTKAGVVNFMRSIAFPFKMTDGIRVYAICPGVVRTNLLNSEGWTTFPGDCLTPIETVVSTVGILVEGGDMTDSRGCNVVAGEDHGLVAEINGTSFYFRDQPEYFDGNMANVMKPFSLDR